MNFQATLERSVNTASTTIVRIPFDPAEVWPNRTKLRVQGSIRAATGGVGKAEFVTSLMRSAGRGYFLLVTAKLRKAANLPSLPNQAHGTLVVIELEPVMDEAAAEPPPELARLLKQDRSVKKWFTKLNYSTRKYIADAILETKSADARVRRAELWMERIMLTMEGEELPPPILRAAFRRQPLAQTGWEAMTVLRRRMMLLSLFSCQSPEAQANRVERLLREATEVAQRDHQPKKRSQRGSPKSSPSRQD